MGVLVSAALIVGVSLLLGTALCGPAKREDRVWARPAPAVGFAAAMTLMWVVVRLPGRGTTGAVVLALAAVIALVRARGHIRPGDVLAALPAVAASSAMVSLPFLAVRRVAALGTSFNDDLALHVLGAQVLAQRSRGDLPGLLSQNYPVGPHSLVAGVSQLLGVSADPAFGGLLLAVPVLTTLVVLSALPELSLRLRTAVAVVCGCSYLPMAFLAQGSFKEPIEALFTLASIPLATELGRAGRSKAAPALLLALITLASAITFTPLGVIWPLGIAAVVVALSPVGRRLLPGRRLLVAAGGLVVGAGVVLGLLAVFTGVFENGFLQYAFHPGYTAGGNLLRSLPALEGLGVWPTDDFRLDPPPGTEMWRVAVAFALLATTLGAAAWARRGRRDVLIAAVTVIGLYAISSGVSSGYASAKALVIATPLVLLVGVGGLMLAEPRERGLVPRLGWTAVVALFVILAASSSAMPLRGAFVRGGAGGQSAGLAQFRRDLGGGRPTLYLGRDNWVDFELRWAGIASLATNYTRYTPLAAIQIGVPLPGGDQLDRITTSELNAVGHVLAPRSLFATSPPPSLRLERQTRWYTLWRKTSRALPRHDVGEGPLPERARLHRYPNPPGVPKPGPAGEAPGDALDCTLPAVRRAAERGGRALVRPAPVITVPPVAQPDGTSLIAPARGLPQTLRLPPGRWEISIRYLSLQPLTVFLGPRTVRMPEYISDLRAYWRVGEVQSTGAPIAMSINTSVPRFPQLARDSQVGPIVAVRSDVKPRLVPIRRACGRYADWYELRGP